MSENQNKQPVAPNDLRPSVDDTPTSNPDNHEAPREIGGRKGPEPTRFGDWEKAGRCIDF